MFSPISERNAPKRPNKHIPPTKIVHSYITEKPNKTIVHQRIPSLLFLEEEYKVQNIKFLPVAESVLSFPRAEQTFQEYIEDSNFDGRKLAGWRAPAISISGLFLHLAEARPSNMKGSFLFLPDAK